MKYLKYTAIGLFTIVHLLIGRFYLLKKGDDEPFKLADVKEIVYGELDINDCEYQKEELTCNISPLNNIGEQKITYNKQKFTKTFTVNVVDKEVPKITLREKNIATEAKLKVLVSDRGQTNNAKPTAKISENSAKTTTVPKLEKNFNKITSNESSDPEKDKFVWDLKTTGMHKKQKTLSHNHQSEKVSVTYDIKLENPFTIESNLTGRGKYNIKITIKHENKFIRELNYGQVLF